MRTSQLGGSMPIFRGTRIQRGLGLGGLFGNFARRLLIPAAKKIGTSLLRSGLEKASRSIEDISRGRNIKSALKDHFVGQHTPETLVRQGLGKAASYITDTINPPRPQKRKRPPMKPKNTCIPMRILSIQGF